MPDKTPVQIYREADERDLTWYVATLEFAIDHNDPASPSSSDVFEAFVEATPEGLIDTSHSMGPADDVG